MERVIFEDFVKVIWEDAAESCDNVVFTNDEYPLLHASPDVLIRNHFNNELIIGEIKFVNLYGSTNGKNGEGEGTLPKVYGHQIQLYMAVTGAKRAIVFAFMQELNDIVTFNLNRDDDYGKLAQQKAEEFFKKVEEYAGPTTIVAPENREITEAYINELKDISIQMKKLETRKKELTDGILLLYSPGTILVYGNTKAYISSKVLKNGTKTQMIRIT